MSTVLVTGANTGIGDEVARQLAAEGFHVLVGARDAPARRKAAEEIAKEGGKATFLEIDVADNDSVATAAREFSRIENHLDVLVNNAGIIADGDNAILEVTDDLFRKTLETNTLGPAARNACLRAVASQKQSAACNQCFKRRRPTDRRRGWLGAAYCT